MPCSTLPDKRSNAGAVIVPKGGKQPPALAVRAPGQQHIFRHGAVIASGKSTRLGEWLEELQGFMADSQVTEVLMFFTQKFTQLDGPVNFTLTTLTDLAWTLLVLVWEFALDGKLPFLGEAEQKLHSQYESLKRQFFECRMAWLSEITEKRDKRRDKKFNASLQEAIHATLEEEIFHWIPQEALEHEQKDYFIESVKEGVKFVLARREDKADMKDMGIQTRGPNDRRRASGGGHPHGMERTDSGATFLSGTADDSVWADRTDAGSPNHRNSIGIPTPRPRQDLEKRIKELQQEKEQAMAKFEVQLEDATSLRKMLEKMQEKLKEAEMSKQLLQEHIDKGEEALAAMASKPVTPVVDMSASRRQNQSDMDRKVWDLERKLAHAETKNAELEAKIAAAAASPSHGNESRSSSKPSRKGTLASELRIEELEAEVRKLKEDRAHLHENFLHMMEEHEQTVLESISAEVQEASRNLGRTSSSSRTLSGSGGVMTKRGGVVKAVNAKVSRLGSRERAAPRADLIPCGVTVDSGVQSLIRQERLDRKYDRGEDHSGNVDVRAPAAAASCRGGAAVSSPREEKESRDDERASRWISSPPDPKYKGARKKQQSSSFQAAGSGSFATDEDEGAGSPDGQTKRRMALEIDPEAPGYEFIAAMRQEVKQRRSSFVARLKEVYKDARGSEEEDSFGGDGGLAGASTGSWDDVPLQLVNVATQTLEQELRSMPVVGKQLPGGGFVGREASQSLDSSGDLSGIWHEGSTGAFSIPELGLGSVHRSGGAGAAVGLPAHVRRASVERAGAGAALGGSAVAAPPGGAHDESGKRSSLSLPSSAGAAGPGGPATGSAGLSSWYLGSLSSGAAALLEGTDAGSELRDAFAQLQGDQQRSDVTLVEMASRVGKLQDELLSRGVEPSVIQETLRELGLDGMSTTTHSCRDVFLRLYRDAMERAQRLLARQKAAFDRMQKRMEQDATFRSLVEMTGASAGLSESEGDGAASRAAMAMRKTMEAFAVLGIAAGGGWQDPLDGGPSATFSELSTIAWITDPQVLPFLERELEIIGQSNLPASLSPRGRTADGQSRSGSRGGRPEAKHCNSQGWPRRPDAKATSPRSPFGLAGKQTSTASLAQMSTQLQLEDGNTSLASLSYLEMESPSTSTLKCASQTSLHAALAPAKHVPRHKPRLLQPQGWGSTSQLSFEEYLRLGAEAAASLGEGKPEQKQKQQQQQLPQKGLLATLAPFADRAASPATSAPVAPKPTGAAAGGFDPATLASAYPGLASAKSSAATTTAAAQLWRVKSQPTTRCSTPQELATAQPTIKIRSDDEVICLIVVSTC